MFKKFVVTGMLAIALFAFIAPAQVYAKDKLSKEKVKEIFDTINSDRTGKYGREVQDALKTIVRIMDNVKKDNSISNAAKNVIEDILGLNQYYSMFSNSVALINMAYNYNQDTIKNGASLAFDSIEFFGGLVLPGGYVRSAVNAAKAGRAALLNHYAKAAYYDYAGIPNLFRPPHDACFDSDYEFFAQEWFAACRVEIKNNEGVQKNRDKTLLLEISDYINALKTLQRYGLINKLEK